MYFYKNNQRRGANEAINKSSAWRFKKLSLVFLKGERNKRSGCAKNYRKGLYNHIYSRDSFDERRSHQKNRVWEQRRNKYEFDANV